MSRKEESGNNTAFSIMPQYYGKFSIVCHVMGAVGHCMLMDTEYSLLEMVRVFGLPVLCAIRPQATISVQPKP
jgi:hypothetical protein